MNEKRYILTQVGPVEVSDMLDNGYKIIGRYKLLNPNPRAITYSDIRFIQEKIGGWLKESYKEVSFSDNYQPSTAFIKDNLHYVFTLMYCGKILEGDFYCISIASNGGEKVNVYIAKAIMDNESFDDTEEGIYYPFFTERWHTTIKNPKPYKSGETW